MVIAWSIADSTSSPPQRRRFFDFGPLDMFAFAGAAAEQHK
jgi:hypothetical protein